MNTVKKKILHYGMLLGMGLFLFFLVAGAQPVKAFSNTTTRWNQECDVIFWDETDECAQDVMKTVLEYLGEEDRKMLFITNYNKEENNLSLEKKLMNLEQQIINKELVNVYDVGSNF